MTDGSSAREAKQRVDEALTQAQKDMPALENLFHAFGELLAETAAFKTELQPTTQPEIPPIDPDRFLQGVPVASRESMRLSSAELGMAAERLLPVMQRGFPKITAELERLGRSLKRGTQDGADLVQALLKEETDRVERIAKELEVPPQVLEFAVTTCIKPFAEKMAERVVPLADELQWLKGYCPICGSWPQMGFIRGKEGQRWLRCSFCGHEWRFTRIACPFCETDDHDKLEILYTEERAFERAELCHSCRRYLVSIDSRERIAEPVPEVAALGLVYLDILAQDRGFHPGAPGIWNVVDGQ
ncbi:MAG: formate dehydrogenase accessory protein FdhE [Thermodesulfobacteriota bacterium]